MKKPSRPISATYNLSNNLVSQHGQGSNVPAGGGQRPPKKSETVRPDVLNALKEENKKI